MGATVFWHKIAITFFCIDEIGSLMFLAAVLFCKQYEFHGTFLNWLEKFLETSIALVFLSSIWNNINVGNL